MSEHARDETRTRESEPDRGDVAAKEPGRAAFSRSAQFLKAGVRLEDIPPKELLEIASRIGNSNFLELLSPRSGIDTAGRVPAPSEPTSYGASNRIRANPAPLIKPPLPAGQPAASRPFLISRLRDRADSGARSSPIIMEGTADGAISD